MLNNIILTLQKKDDKNTFIILIFMFLAIQLFFSGVLLQSFKRITGGGIILDFGINITYAQAYLAVRGYGELGTKLYKLIKIFECFYIVFYVYVMLMFIVRILTNIQLVEKYKWVVLLPILLGGVDLIENIIIYGILVKNVAGFAGLFSIFSIAVKVKFLILALIIFLFVIVSIFEFSVLDYSKD